MALEVTKSAALTYQGSSSGAAKPVKAAESKMDTGKLDTGRVQAGRDGTDVQPIQPVQEDSAGQSGFSSKGDSNHQKNKQLQEAVEKMKKNMMGHTEPVFGIHEGTNRVTIKIVDKETKDVVKEYPPEETLDMIQKVWEMAGIVVDEKM